MPGWLFALLAFAAFLHAIAIVTRIKEERYGWAGYHAAFVVAVTFFTIWQTTK